MPFNKELHANLGFIDRPIKEQLEVVCEAEGRTIKAELEYLIKQAFKNLQA